MKKLLITLGIISAISCSVPQKKENQEVLLIISDFGRDVDDAQAFAFIAEQINGKTELLNIIGKKKGLKLKYNGVKPIIAGVICTGYIHLERAKTLKNFLEKYEINCPIAIPEVAEKDSLEVLDYYNSHLVNGKPYELELLSKLEDGKDKEYKFTTPKNLIDSLSKQYNNAINVLIIAQPTQFTNTIEELRKEGKNPLFKRIIIQGQYKEDNKKLKPDFSAYNLREDSHSSYELFELQETTPFIFLSKHATYPYAIAKEETEYIKSATNGGEYLKDAAIMGLQSFLERDSSLFYKIFKLPPTTNKESAIDSLKVLNNPYDLLTTIYLFYPEIFETDTIIGINNIKHINVVK